MAIAENSTVCSNRAGLTLLLGGGPLLLCPAVLLLLLFTADVTTTLAFEEALKSRVGVVGQAKAGFGT